MNEEEQNAGERVPCSTIDDDSDLFRTRNGLIDPRYRWRFFDVYIDPSYSKKYSTHHIIQDIILGMQVQKIKFLMIRRRKS